MKSCKTFFSLLAVGVLFAGSAVAQKGNDLPKGQKQLFNLEVIAYSGNNCPSGDFTGSNTHRIAVKADVNDSPAGQNPNTIIRQNDIMLRPGDFQVLDGNACTDGVATFQLPLNPCVEGGTVNDQCSVDDPQFQVYEVYARLVGKPGTGVNVTTCATDPLDPTTEDDDVIVCSTESWIEMRQKGSSPKFSNVSKQLLSICVDTDGIVETNPCDERWALFASQFEEWFWNWNTDGKAHAQLRFVAVPD